jgi:hypothetical protein
MDFNLAKSSNNRYYSPDTFKKGISDKDHTIADIGQK